MDQQVMIGRWSLIVIESKRGKRSQGFLEPPEDLGGIAPVVTSAWIHFHLFSLYVTSTGHHHRICVTTTNTAPCWSRNAETSSCFRQSAALTPLAPLNGPDVQVDAV